METKLKTAHKYFDGTEHEALNYGYRLAIKDVIRYAQAVKIDRAFINTLIDLEESV